MESKQTDDIYKLTAISALVDALSSVPKLEELKTIDVTPENYKYIDAFKRLVTATMLFKNSAQELLDAYLALITEKDRLWKANKPN